MAQRKVVGKFVTRQASTGVFTETNVNPKTGRGWTLADPEIKAQTSAELAAMRADPSKAKAFLHDIGLLTATGKLARKYGG